MPTRILSISGLRGIVGDGLDPEFVTRFAMAVGTLFERRPVVLARDGRSTGPLFEHAVIAGLTATGCDVLHAGIAMTPTCGVLVTNRQAGGGIMISASHNPIEYNGLKPFGPGGSVFNAEQGQRLLSVLESGQFALQPWDRLGRVVTVNDPVAPHLDRVQKLIDPAAIRARRFKVVLDCCHGAGVHGGPELLAELGCEVHVLGGTPDGQFEHTPEPLAQNLTGLAAAVKTRGADVGFAQDPDADRLAIIDERGIYIGEELTFALAADFVLPRRPGAIVINGSTSRTAVDIAARHGCRAERSYVGEAHVTARMQAIGAVLGGEGNGGVIEPQVGYVRDSLVSMAYVLNGLATRPGPLSAWVATLPQYTIVKNKISCPASAVGEACLALRTAFPTAVATEGDGLRLDWDDRWVQVRASNTEPILRVISEAPQADAAEELCATALREIRRAVGS